MKSKENPLKKYLFSPSKDFLLLGGGSLVLLFFVRLIISPDQENIANSVELTLLLANLINHPHFAASYIIFYDDFKNKLISSDYEKSLRIRYWVFGLIAPLVLILGMAYLVIENEVKLLGLSANLMFLLVGWHYVKQGYGMVMLDASLKKSFFKEKEKNILLINSYATWILAWLLINFLAKNKAPIYFGIPYVALDVPEWAIIILIIIVVFTTLNVLRMIFGIWRNGRDLPWNGLIAYAVSLYLWLLVRDPIIILWVPLFHSLQYLTVVWRFQWNRFSSVKNSKINSKYKFIMFFSISIFLGYCMFVKFPSWLDANVSYNENIYGNSLFFFLFWIFINIHHYLLDTVMWRKGNPEVKKYLFS